MSMSMSMNSVENMAGQSIWIRPASVSNLQNSMWWWVGYKTMFYSECPMNGAWLKIESSGYVYLRVNGRLLSLNSIMSWPNSQMIYIPSWYMSCGCNHVEYWVNSPYPWNRYEAWMPPQD